MKSAHSEECTGKCSGEDVTCLQEEVLELVLAHPLQDLSRESLLLLLQLSQPLLPLPQLLAQLLHLDRGDSRRSL